MKPMTDLKEGALLQVEELEGRLAPDGVTIHITGGASGVLAVAASNGDEHGQGVSQASASASGPNGSVAVSGQNSAVAIVTDNGSWGWCDGESQGDGPCECAPPPVFRIFHWWGNDFEFEVGNR